MDLRWPRVYRRSNVGLVVFITIIFINTNINIIFINSRSSIIIIIFNEVRTEVVITSIYHIVAILNSFL